MSSETPGVSALQDVSQGSESGHDSDRNQDKLQLTFASHTDKFQGAEDKIGLGVREAERSRRLPYFVDVSARSSNLSQEFWDQMGGFCGWPACRCPESCRSIELC